MPFSRSDNLVVRHVVSGSTRTSVCNLEPRESSYESRPVSVDDGGKGDPRYWVTSTCVRGSTRAPAGVGSPGLLRHDRLYFLFKQVQAQFHSTTTPNFPSLALDPHPPGLSRMAILMDRTVAHVKSRW